MTAELISHADNGVSMHKTVDIEMEHDVLHENHKIAHENSHLLEDHNIVSIDFMGSIGSGKTALIIKLSEKLRAKGKKITAIAGDVTGSDDFTRMMNAGVSAVNCNTGHECHLDAMMIRKILKRTDLSQTDVLFVENVGNLVCPADFPLGTDKRVVVISVTEGDDMVRKHPDIFHKADLAILNKVDIAEHVDVDTKVILEDYRKLTGGNKKMIECSVKKGFGIDEIIKELGL